jgi:exopolysaccharide biosynthesis polyprenyl glycosylphosphotransferase
MASATTTLPTLVSASAPANAHDERSFARSIPAARVVAACDVGVVLTTLGLILAFRTVTGWPDSLSGFLSLHISVQNLVSVIGVAAVTVAVFAALGLYNAARVRRRGDEVARVFLATAALAALAAAVLATSRAAVLDRLALVSFWAASCAAVAVFRAGRAWLAQSAWGCRRALIVGSGPQALRICRELSRDPRVSYRVLGFVDSSTATPSPFMTRRTLGSLDALEAILVREHVDEVHVGLPVKSHYPHIQETIRVCERVGVKVVYGADIFGTELARARVDRACQPAPRVELQVVTEGIPVIVKRAVDVLGATIVLLIAGPLMLATAAAIALTSDGPILFAQERYGLNRRRFRMWKFRTMVKDAERLQAPLESRNEVQGPVFKITHDPRVTPLGRWLRRTSIDELPQLFNVLRGDMSLVGPRPLPIRDVLRFTRSSDMRRFSVRPGLTGLWQVSGRSRLDFDQWITLDLRYIDRWSLALDFVILARTIPAVIRGTGAM